MAGLTAAATARSGPATTLLSTEPSRRAVERYWLLYTPIWGLVAAILMLGGVVEDFGDLELMVLGIAFAGGAVLPPILRPHESEAELPWWRRTATKMVVGVTGFSLLMNYFCTPYFFDVLHMHYGFASTINIENNPVFLYLMTVAYFATYAVLVCAAYRFTQRALSPRFRWLGGLSVFVVAFLETALNANPFMTGLFCFDDMRFMLWFGTLSYGLCFVFALPVWLSIGRHRSHFQIVRDTFAAMLAIVMCFALLRHHVAPLVTTVEPNAQNLRDYGDGCLAPQTQ